MSNTKSNGGNVRNCRITVPIGVVIPAFSTTCEIMSLTNGFISRAIDVVWVAIHQIGRSG